MLQELPTIYRARNLQEAQLLCNILEEEGIRATVTNGVLENGSGVDILGWPTLARVVVGRKDAVRAREIALNYDRQVIAKSGEVEQIALPAALEGGEVEGWPCCPECGARRLTHCPFCGTSGTHFPPADANMGGDVLGLPTPSAEAFSACSCGPGGCGAHRPESREVPVAAGERECSVSGESEVDSETSSALVICPTCDEPFAPQYLRRCEWCGHEFADGMETPMTTARAPESFNWRIGYAIYLLALIAFGLALYLLWLF